MSGNESVTGTKAQNTAPLDGRLVVFALNKKISSYVEISCKIWVKIASKSVLKCLFNLDV